VLANDGAGRNIILGIRPQHLRVIPHLGVNFGADTTVGSARVSVTVDLIEQLGAEAFLHATLGDVPLVAQLDPSHARTLRRGESALVEFSRAHTHVFDLTSGQSLRPQS
jgi:multiple sugar transport system ATP-binding protein